MTAHPDRLAATLAQLGSSASADADVEAPGPGSADARVDLKLLCHRTKTALAERGTPQAEARLAGLTSEHLWAGTVQDGAARGFSVALEETISLCRPAPASPEPAEAEEVLTGAELRRKRDLLVASAGARVRFTRKGGLLLVDRAHDVHEENFICFEDRTDTGTLDGFAPLPGERCRLFHPGFLQPVRLERGPGHDLLVLEGRLGRRSSGYPCRMRIEGHKEEQRVRLTVAVRNDHPNHRLRIRFRGSADAVSACGGTPAWERVNYEGRSFRAATIVRACGVLPVGDDTVAVPDAQCMGWIEHAFNLGGAS